MPNITYEGVTYDRATCTLGTCPLALANVRYVPSLGGNATYLALFMILLASQCYLGIKHKTWGFMGGMLGGLMLEIIGYGARIGMHYNPFNTVCFFAYLITLTIGPAFLTASIYLCLARIVVVFGSNISRFQPRFYTITFVTCDIISLILQAAGGAIAAGSTKNATMGEHIMLGGLAFQVFSLILFSLLCAEFGWRVYSVATWDHNPAFSNVTRHRRFQLFLLALALATLLIIVRSAFRVAELEDGFTSGIANNEGLFMVLEGPMIIIAVAVLTLSHPGYAFNGEWNSLRWSFRAVKTGPIEDYEKA
ncbi:hypothetical protein BBP40_010932 [Aspergillus hancockii]|nr:hypothetical protein BBP40_010932 [Aspergillus hancockii]